MKQSGGHIKIYSEIGQGTSIKIYLPRYYGLAEARKHPKLRTLVRGASSEVVLVVEDDEQVLALTAQMLRDLGYGVIEAVTGEEALAALSAHPEVRLLFMDVVMPDVVHNRVLDPGVNLLQKPASLEQLALKIRTVLDG